MDGSVNMKKSKQWVPMVSPKKAAAKGKSEYRGVPKIKLSQLARAR